MELAAAMLMCALHSQVKLEEVVVDLRALALNSLKVVKASTDRTKYLRCACARAASRWDDEEARACAVQLARYELAVDESIPTYVLGDSVNLRKVRVLCNGLVWLSVCKRTRGMQVILNLIGNAAKFTPENGSILVQLNPYGPIVEYDASSPDRVQTLGKVRCRVQQWMMEAEALYRGVVSVHLVGNGHRIGTDARRAGACL